jgi:predicted O-methyltransferase YrrM
MSVGGSGGTAEAGDGWSLGDEVVSVDGVEFRLGYHGGSSSTRFSLIKPLALLERYRAVDPPISGSRVLELGIAEGGSTAWMALEFQPELLISVDISDQPVAALDALIRERDLSNAVRPRWGVDQADRDLLHRVLDRELDGAPLDLVFDDASHRYEPTRASFEALFPLLRPGGLYVIEDWSWELREAEIVRSYFTDPAAPDPNERREQLVDAIADPSRWQTPARSMSHLAIEFEILCVLSSDVVASVELNQHWIMLRRGVADLDPATFSLDAIVHDDLHLLEPLPHRSN